MRQQILEMTSSSSRSTRPAIYGIVAAAEVERLRPLSGIVSTNEVQTLELAAAEMSQVAAELVATERDILRLRSKGTDERTLAAREAMRAESASALERKMAAMQAVMAARRTVLVEAEAAVAPPMSKAEQIMEKFKPPAMSSQAVGGAGSGNGYEILFQGFNWESCKHNWYKTLSGQLRDIAKTGFTSVWLPPPSESVSPQGYLPGDLYKMDSVSGISWGGCVWAPILETMQCMNGHDAGLNPDAILIPSSLCSLAGLRI